MPLDFSKVTPPSDDRRWKMIGATMRRHGHDASALIETLHTVQETFGYLEEEALRFVALSLKLPLSKVYGVATFYHHFTLKPQGKHTCVLCTGTACYIKGVPDLLAALKEHFNVKPGETTKDGELSLLTARCVGACGLAPVATIDGEFAGKLTPAILVDRIKRCINNER